MFILNISKTWKLGLFNFIVKLTAIIIAGNNVTIITGQVIINKYALA